MHENEISMHKNEMSTSENEIPMLEIKKYKMFTHDDLMLKKIHLHAWKWNVPWVKIKFPCMKTKILPRELHVWDFHAWNYIV